MWTISSLLFYNICMNASKNLHDRMFSSLLKAPVQFFHINTSGEFMIDSNVDKSRIITMKILFLNYFVNNYFSGWKGFFQCVNYPQILSYHCTYIYVQHLIRF